METQARYVLVGITTLVLLLALGFVLYWLSQSKSEEQFRSYAIYFREQGLGGVARGSVVTMRGIRVGSVDSVQLLHGNEEGARVIVKVGIATPVGRKTEGVVKTNLLTGLSTIELETGNGEKGEPVAIAGETLPVINEGDNKFSKLGGTLEDVFMRINSSLGKIESGLNEENISALGNTLKNIERVTDLLANDKEIKGMLVNLAKLVEEARATNQKLHELGDNVSASSRATSLSIENMSRSVDRLQSSVSRAAEGFEDPQSILMGKNPALRGPGEDTIKRLEK